LRNNITYENYLRTLSADRNSLHVHRFSWHHFNLWFTSLWYDRAIIDRFVCGRLEVVRVELEQGVRRDREVQGLFRRSFRALLSGETKGGIQFLDCGGKLARRLQELKFLQRITDERWEVMRQIMGGGPSCEDLHLEQSLLEDARLYADLKEMEGLLGTPIPLSSLTGLLGAKVHNAPRVDGRAVQTLIDRLNESSLSVPKVHALFHRIVQYMPLKVDEGEALGALYLALEQKGCTFFQRPDPLHCPKEGDVSPFGRLGLKSDQGFEMGKQVVVYSPLNGPRAAIDEMRQRESRQLPLRFLQATKIAPDGTALLQPKLRGRASVVEPRQESLVDQLKVCARIGKMPQGQLADQLWVTEEGEVVWLRASSQTRELDPIAIEEWLLSCGWYHPDKVREILQASGISSHPRSSELRARLVSLMLGPKVPIEWGPAVVALKSALTRAVNRLGGKPELRSALMPFIQNGLQAHGAIVQVPSDFHETLIRCYRGA